AAREAHHPAGLTLAGLRSAHLAAFHVPPHPSSGRTPVNSAARSARVIVTHCLAGSATPCRLCTSNAATASSLPRATSASAWHSARLIRVTFLHSITTRSPYARTPPTSPRSLAPVLTLRSIRSSTWSRR